MLYFSLPNFESANYLSSKFLQLDVRIVLSGARRYRPCLFNSVWADICEGGNHNFKVFPFCFVFLLSLLFFFFLKNSKLTCESTLNFPTWNFLAG